MPEQHIRVIDEEYLDQQLADCSKEIGKLFDKYKFNHAEIVFLLEGMKHQHLKWAEGSNE